MSTAMSEIESHYPSGISDSTNAGASALQFLLAVEFGANTGQNYGAGTPPLGPATRYSVAASVKAIKWRQQASYHPNCGPPVAREPTQSMTDIVLLYL